MKMPIAYQTDNMRSFLQFLPPKQWTSTANDALHNSHPSKRDTLTQCWPNVGPPSTTLGQHYSALGERVVLAGKYQTEYMYIHFDVMSASVII